MSRSHRPAVYVDLAESLGALAVIRSLGAAGYEVHAASALPGALGARSRYAEYAPVHPPVDAPAFRAWLRRYLREWRIDALIPSEGLALALGSSLPEFHPLMPFGESPAQMLRSFGKFDLFDSSLAQGLSDHLGTVRLYDFEHHQVRGARQLCFPVFVKTDALYARRSGEGGAVWSARDAQALDEVLDAAKRLYTRAVVQGYASGVGVGACFVLWDGEVAAEFMHRRLHEVPYSGGISSWRREFEHPQMRADALARVRALGLRRGPVMVEYRWDPVTEHFTLMEVNARFWGSLHLPYYAGVDLPGVLLQRFLDSRGVSPPAPLLAGPRRRGDISCRHLPAELQHCWSKLKSGELSLAVKLAAVGQLFGLAWHPRVKSDLGSFPGDRRLLLLAMGRFLASAVRALKRRLGARRLSGKTSRASRVAGQSAK